MRFLPSGSIALVEYLPVEARPYAVSIVDPEGHRRALSEGWLEMTSGGWCERTHELWFVASRAGEDLALQAVDLQGRVRLVARVLGSFWGLDVDAQGRALVSRGVERIVTMALPPRRDPRARRVGARLVQPG